MRYLQTDSMSSQDNVVEAAEVQLRRNKCMCVRGLVCEYCAGKLVLRGRVPSYYYKQVAQEAVKEIEGVDQVINDTEVVASIS